MMNESVNKWYRKQKNHGLIYKVVIGEDVYVGATTNSLKKRLWQHRAKGSSLRSLGYDTDTASIELLEKLQSVKKLREREQYWIDKLKPIINVKQAVRRKVIAEFAWKGGITVNGKWYRTRKEAWKKLGKVAYGTLKSRYHRTGDFLYALGINELMSESKK